MKKIFMMALLCAIAGSLKAQSIFPTDGSNVGIGTTTPGAALSISNSMPVLQIFDSRGNPGDASSMGKIAFGSVYGEFASIEAQREPGSADDVSKLIFRTSWATGAGGDGTNKERMRINPNGNVGIGTATPSANLEVNTNTLIGQGGNKYNSALTLIKNGDSYGIDNPVLVIKHSGNGSNVFGNPVSDLGIIRITGFNTGVANKSINSNDNFYVFTNGTVGVNTNYVPLGYQLAINGSAIATSVTVQLKSAWPDYVFKPSYQLKPLSEVKTYIDENHHLPEMPSEKEVADKGLNLGEMNKILTKKVEELTLYLIEKDKEVKQQEKINQSQEARLKTIEQQLKISDKTQK